MKALFAMHGAERYLIIALLLLLLHQIPLLCTKSVKECPCYWALLSTVGLERSLLGDMVRTLN